MYVTWANLDHLYLLFCRHQEKIGRHRYFYIESYYSEWSYVLH